MEECGGAGGAHQGAAAGTRRHHQPEGKATAASQQYIPYSGKVLQVQIFAKMLKCL